MFILFNISSSRGCNKKNVKKKKIAPGVYGLCSTICPIRFRPIPFKIQRIVGNADHSRDHRGCAKQYCFSIFYFWASLKSSRFQVVKGIIIAKSVIVNKPRTPREILYKLKKQNHLRLEGRDRLDTFISTSVGWKTWKIEIQMKYRVQFFARFFILGFLINWNIRSPAEPRRLSKSVA